MSKKDKLIQKLQNDVDFLNDENNELNNELIRVIQHNNDLRYKHPLDPEPEPSIRKILWNRVSRQPRYAADISLDVLPVRDWFRFRWSPYSLGKYAQLCIGPLRLEFYRT